MQQSPSWEAAIRSPNQEIPRLLWNPKFHYRIHKIPPLDHILVKSNSFHTWHPISSRWMLILSSIPAHVSKTVPSFQVFRLKICMHFYMFLASCVTIIILCGQSKSNYEAPHCTVFPILLFLSPFQVKIFPLSTLFSNVLSLGFWLRRESVFLTHKLERVTF
jgi:hypothetical protein